MEEGGRWKEGDEEGENNKQTGREGEEGQ